MWLHFVEVLEAANRAEQPHISGHTTDGAAHDPTDTGHVWVTTDATHTYAASTVFQVNWCLWTYTVALRMSEWIWATPLTAWEPTIHKWAMLILFCPPSSMRDIRHRRPESPGYLAATLCNTRPNRTGSFPQYRLWLLKIIEQVNAAILIHERQISASVLPGWPTTHKIFPTVCPSFQ